MPEASPNGFLTLPVGTDVVSRANYRVPLLEIDGHLQTHQDGIAAVTTEVTNARTSDVLGAFANLDARLEAMEELAIAPATYVVAASDSVRKESAHYICDGTDDHVQINQALTALPANGGSVLLLAGTYTIAGSIEIPAKGMLMGMGVGSIIKLKDGHNADISLVKNKAYGGSVIIQDLLIDGNLPNQASGYPIGIELAGENSGSLSGYHCIRHITVRNTNTAVTCAFIHSSDISQNVFHNTSGVLLAYMTTNVGVIGNVIACETLGTDIGIQVESRDNTLPANVHGIVILGNQIQNCSHGISLGEGSQMCVVEGNSIATCGYGIVAGSGSTAAADLSYGHQIIHNSTTGTESSGIWLDGVGVQDLQVVGNRVHRAYTSAGTGRGGIEIDEAADVMVQANQVRQGTGTADYGILILAGSTNAWVTNNDLRDSGATGGLSDAGTATVTTAGNQS